MLNNTDFDIFITQSISDAHIRLRNKDEAYKEKCKRKANIHEILENTIKDKNINFEQRHWDMLEEYLDLESDLFIIQHTATYFQAIFECICLLHNFGFLRE